ncbi:helix-turn-helix domain-containing protein [Wenzhouxiangella sp. XN201]|uniref:GlxA family transcriptional regulator n=1 Tax=Wenzhouxiangella sp. XN201 TaxID=2710755 RepID=UPI0013C56EEB|nr:helix-turn-helix domain-containing protein [Wenzhouxiangella sp. XN201]NEZ02996.1 helix-turn-helix domain-containing protein [Wenzhouxiangella sp. XN201]
MNDSDRKLVAVDIVAVPETAGSALYGMVDVLSAAGELWQTLTHESPAERRLGVQIVAPAPGMFRCGHGVPVVPEKTILQGPAAPVVILPELWLGPEESFHGRYPELMTWLKAAYAAGSEIYSACSGAIMLAESGLLDGCAATSHWGYRALFEREYPQIDFRPEPNLVVADAEGRIVTAGGSTSWHDLALHIIARHISPGEALRIAKVYLLKWHGEGQLPFEPLVRDTLHADAAIRRCEGWLADHFADEAVIAGVTEYSGLAERTLKRRFKRATGVTLKDYVQNLRVEEAKQLLESTGEPVDEICARVGYEDESFFRRLFKRRTGLTPARYRRLFRPVARLAEPAPAEGAQSRVSSGAGARRL